MARKTPGKTAPQLSCPGCHTAFSLAAVLDHCDVSWPNQRWRASRLGGLSVTLGAPRWQVKGKG